MRGKKGGDTLDIQNGDLVAGGLSPDNAQRRIKKALDTLQQLELL